MNFVTLEFWILVCITTLGCRLSKDQNVKLGILAGASIIFYLWWDYRFLILLIGYTMVTYAISRRIKPGEKKYTLLFVIISLGMLGWFKYYNFFVESFSYFSTANIKLLDIVLPLGISFYVLTAIGYILDIYYGKYTVETSYLKVLVFLIFFPKILSGPIERGNVFFEKLEHMKVLTRNRLSTAMQIILFGLIKKLVIADRLGAAVDAVFEHPEIYAAPALICAGISFSIQIYCDFSGYTDIAAGVAYLLGIELCPNFNLPYCSENPSEFWRRWHISLSSWFRDYVYIPMGGSRKKSASTYKNILCTMLLSGLWHGANWTFILWGLIHGIAQCMYKAVHVKIKMPRGIGIVLNFIFVSIAWIYFRADSIGIGNTILQGIIGWQSGVKYIYVYTPIYAALVFGWDYFAYKHHGGNSAYMQLDLNKTVHFGIFIAEVLLLVALAYFGNGAFIYNKF